MSAQNALLAGFGIVGGIIAIILLIIVLFALSGAVGAGIGWLVASTFNALLGTAFYPMKFALIGSIVSLASSGSVAASAASD